MFCVFVKQEINSLFCLYYGIIERPDRDGINICRYIFGNGNLFRKMKAKGLREMVDEILF